MTNVQLSPKEEISLKREAWKLTTSLYEKSKGYVSPSNNSAAYLNFKLHNITCLYIYPELMENKEFKKRITEIKDKIEFLRTNTSGSYDDSPDNMFETYWERHLYD